MFPSGHGGDWPYPFDKAVSDLMRLNEVAGVAAERNRQIVVAVDVAAPRKRWPQNPPMCMVGAYHLGRLEALLRVQAVFEGNPPPAPLRDVDLQKLKESLGVSTGATNDGLE